MDGWMGRWMDGSMDGWTDQSKVPLRVSLCVVQLKTWHHTQEDCTVNICI